MLASCCLLSMSRPKFIPLQICSVVPFQTLLQEERILVAPYSANMGEVLFNLDMRDENHTIHVVSDELNVY